MVPFFRVISLVLIAVAACLHEVFAVRRYARFSSPCGDRTSVGGIHVKTRGAVMCENAAHVECLAKIAGNLDDFQEKGAARVECLAERDGP